MDGPFEPFFRGASWDAWRSFLAAVFALPMSDTEATLFERCTGRRTAPTTHAREAWMVVGRRGGKSRIAALLAVFLAAFRRYELAPGERGVVMVIAADRRQARVVFRYVRALIESVDMLRAMVLDRPTKEAIHLTNGISIEVHTASFRSVRGYTIAAVVLDEIAFWPTDDAADPDHEVLAALLPAMATIPDALLVALSSPYARRGELWRTYSEHFGVDSDVLVWQADTATMNPRVPQAVIDRAYAEDPAAARAEYGGQFRTDIAALIAKETLDAVVVQGRQSLPPTSDIAYSAFCDAAGGSGTDSFTLATAHQRDDTVVLDAVFEQKPPFSPEATVRAFAEELKRYGISKVVGDHYAGEWPAEQFRKCGIEYERCEKPKSTIYLESLPLLNSRRVELLDDARLLRQLARLERRTARGGRDTIDHAPGQHDDVANAACGALVHATGMLAGAHLVVARTTFGGGGHPNFPICWSGVDPITALDARYREQSKYVARTIHW